MPAGEFYIGYLPRAPKELARVLTRVIRAAILLALGIALVLILAQRPFPHATFEFEQYRDFSGFIAARPYPLLLVPRPGAENAQPAYSRYLLVAPGKHGADADVLSFQNKSVRLRGSLIYRDGQTMIELLPGTVTPQSSNRASPAMETELGLFTVTGEIVDSKCYLGVMNPGRTKVHRDCAARCISGGVPPMLAAADATYLLTGADGRKLNQEVLGWVGETVEVRGTVLRSGETLTLRADPGAFRRAGAVR